MAEVSLMLNILQYTHQQSQNSLRKRREKGNWDTSTHTPKFQNFTAKPQTAEIIRRLSFVQFFKQKIPFYYTPSATVHSFKSQIDFLIYIDLYQATQNFLKSQVSCTLRQTAKHRNLSLKNVFHEQQTHRIFFRNSCPLLLIFVLK